MGHKRNSRKRKNMVKFTDLDHKYSSEDNTQWESVTTIVKRFQEPFDSKTIAEKSAKNKKSKWYGMTPKEIIKAWDDISTTAKDLGNWYHSQQEQLVCDLNSIEKDGDVLKIVKPIYLESVKHAPDQKLENNHIYPEHFCYLHSRGICGQSDLVEVRNNKVNIIDFKTNKELTTQGYVNWQGISKKLLKPLSHMEDCKLSIYNIQLSLYMYIILKHNPQLKPGNLIIHHIIFKEVDHDRLGNKQIERDANGDPVVERVDKYQVPYLKKEIELILKYIK